MSGVVVFEPCDASIRGLELSQERTRPRVSPRVPDRIRIRGKQAGVCVRVCLSPTTRRDFCDDVAGLVSLIASRIAKAVRHGDEVPVVVICKGQAHAGGVDYLSEEVSLPPIARNATARIGDGLELACISNVCEGVDATVGVDGCGEAIEVIPPVGDFSAKFINVPRNEATLGVERGLRGTGARRSSDDIAVLVVHHRLRLAGGVNRTYKTTEDIRHPCVGTRSVTIRR